MIGWMILFALIAVLAAVVNFTGSQSVGSAMGVLLFALLFVIGLVTRLGRGRAW